MKEKWYQKTWIQIIIIFILWGAVAWLLISWLKQDGWIYSYFPVDANNLWEAFNTFNALIWAVTLLLVYLTYTSQKEELSLTRQELKNSAEMMRQQKEIMDEEKKIMEEEKFHNYFSFLLKQKERYADDFYKKIEYTDSGWGFYRTTILSKLIDTNYDRLYKNRTQQKRLKNIQPKNFESISEYMSNDYGGATNYDSWLEQNNLKADIEYQYIWSNFKYSNIRWKNDAKLTIDEQEELVTNFYSSVGNDLQKQETGLIDDLHANFDILSERYDVIISNYKKIIETLNNEVKHFMAKIDSQNQEKKRVFLLFIKTERDINFLGTLAWYQIIQERVWYKAK